MGAGPELAVLVLTYDRTEDARANLAKLRPGSDKARLIAELVNMLAEVAPESLPQDENPTQRIILTVHTLVTQNPDSAVLLYVTDETSPTAPTSKY